MTNYSKEKGKFSAPNDLATEIEDGVFLVIVDESGIDYIEEAAIACDFTVEEDGNFLIVYDYVNFLNNLLCFPEEIGINTSKQIKCIVIATYELFEKIGKGIQYEEDNKLWH